MATIEDAIKAISPTTEFSCSPADSTTGITWLSGSPISAEDLEAKKAELTAAEKTVVAQKATDKTSGKAKLKSGDALTDAEISALFGDN
jgi:hypothetical protein